MEFYGWSWFPSPSLACIVSLEKSFQCSRPAKFPRLDWGPWQKRPCLGCSLILCAWLCARHREVAQEGFVIFLPKEETKPPAPLNGWNDTKISMLSNITWAVWSVLGTIQSTLQLFLTMNLWGWYCSSLRLTERRNRSTQRCIRWHKVSQLD